MPFAAGIACVEKMRRLNLPKLLLLALNGGHDQLSGTEVGPQMEVYPDEYLEIIKTYLGK